jgi:hypothetical protein
LQEPDFTEERIVVREGEEVQKKGWFSRRKKPSAGPLSPVSRPPSAASSQKKSTSNSSTPDEDLPPRIEKDDPPPPYTNGQPPNGEAGPSDAELPKHAGFDLSAMKKIIENAELNPAELQVQDPDRYPVPPIPPPTNRSESTPLPLHESPSTTPVMRSSMQLASESESVPKSSSRIDLNAAFQRSVSMNDLREEPEATTLSVYSQPSDANLQDGPGAPSYSTPRPSLPSALPSAGSNSAWAGDIITKPDSHALDSQPLGPFAATNPFANHNGLITPSSSSYSLPHNPFADVSSQSVGLSFGGVDGTITPNAEAERDPWGSRPLHTKVSGFSSNPWQS